MKRGRNPEEKNLVWINPPDDKRSAIDVAYNIMNLLSNEFTISQQELLEWMQCSRPWCLNNITPNVKHIFLNIHIRKFLKAAIEDEEAYNYVKSSYLYYSKESLMEYLNNKANVTVQTCRVDLLKYSIDKKITQKIIDEYNDKKEVMRLKKMPKIAMLSAEEEYNAKMLENLNQKGRQLFMARTSMYNRDAEPVSIKKCFPESITTVSELKTILGYNSVEQVYRYLYEHAAVKYEICGKIYYDKDEILNGNSILTSQTSILVKMTEYKKICERI